jgi:hypothetical protein
MANISSREDAAFLNDLLNIPDNFLEQAAEWINHNLEPEDVFDTDKLETWAENNGFVKEEEI